MTPLPLDPKYTPGEAELLAGLREILELRGALTANLAALKEAIEPPWTAVARLTRREDPNTVWSRANESRRAFWTAFLRHRVAAREAGAWSAWRDLTLRASIAGWCVARLYSAAALHRCHIVGVFDHRRDITTVGAWCG